MKKIHIFPYFINHLVIYQQKLSFLGADDWTDCCTIYTWDLSSNLEAYNSDFNPTARIGFYKFAATFNEPTTEPISIILLSEHDSTITFSRTGIQINFSFLGTPLTDFLF